MLFYVNIKNINKVEVPCFALESNTWDDYSYKTTFHLYYINESRTYIEIGGIKIMHSTSKRTLDVIPDNFTELDDEYCSLGEDINYYEKFKKLFPSNYEEFLDRLNDAAFFPAIRDSFENSAAFKNSLLRFSEAEKALNQAKSIIENIPIDQAFQFTYNCKIENAEDLHRVPFNFGDCIDLPNRIICIVGTNGSGKTQFLAKLAMDLSGKGRKLRSSDLFVPHRPLFSKIIAVSYSVFDKFSKPAKDKSFSYKYCGLRDEKGLIGQKKLVENYQESAIKIEELNRINDWHTILASIIGYDLTNYYYEEIFVKRNYEIVNQNEKRLLSSGQSFLMYVLTEVIANIRKDSLLLFDEPEMHLHPNAIANLTRAIDRILERFDSYAILATHSPIIIQEIPSRYVLVFEREGNIPIVRKLGIESFGESIEVLTEEVFRTKDVSDTYKEVFIKLRQTKSYNEVLNLFDDKLSLNAKAFLFGLYNNQK